MTQHPVARPWWCELPQAAAWAARIGVAVLGVYAMGCQSLQTPDRILQTAEQAVRASMQADDALEGALRRHSQREWVALDQSFLSDFQHLAEQSGGQVSYKDLAKGKALYDEKLSDILHSRESLRLFFEKKVRTQQAGLDLILKARDLLERQYSELDHAERIIQEMQQVLSEHPSRDTESETRPAPALQNEKGQMP